MTKLFICMYSIHCVMSDVMLSDSHFTKKCLCLINTHFATLSLIVSLLLSSCPSGLSLYQALRLSRVRAGLWLLGYRANIKSYPSERAGSELQPSWGGRNKTAISVTVQAGETGVSC